MSRICFSMCVPCACIGIVFLSACAKPPQQGPASTKRSTVKEGLAVNQPSKHDQQSVEVNGVSIRLSRLSGLDSIKPAPVYSLDDVLSSISCEGRFRSFGANDFTIRSESDALHVLKLFGDEIESLSFRLCDFRWPQRYVLEFENLRFVHFDDCTSSDGSFLKHLKPGTHVKAVEFVDLRLSKEDLSWILAQKNLEHLSLRRAEVTPDAVERICSELPLLRRLNLRYVKGMDIRTLKCLGKLKKLEDLDIGWIPLGDDSLAVLPELSSLRMLNLSGTRISDEGMAWVGRVTNLEELWINSTEVSDKGVLKLSNCGKLSHLEWINTRVTVDGIRRLVESNEREPEKTTGQRQSRRKERAGR